MDHHLLIGIDCATDDAKVGLARAECGSGKPKVTAATLCARERSAAGTLASWLRDVRTPVLLAFDAPLGWPAALGQNLATHRAGEAINVDPNVLFRRATDRFIQAKLGKTPLDVGADRIARTAHAALKLLADLRTTLGATIPLAWEVGLSGISAIEVYPAATLVAHNFRSVGYKKPSQVVERREILSSLSPWIDFAEFSSTLESNADVLDSVVCVLAAKDFLDGCALAPLEPAMAAQEGWIWTRRPRT